MSKITQFTGAYKWLSNSYQSFIELRGVVFPSVEAAFQASKVPNYHLDAIFCKMTPGQAKTLGRSVIIRDDWDRDKFELMETLLRIKFKDEHFRAALLKTGDTELYNGNSDGDHLWGCDWETLEGENELGIMLMKLRKEYES